MDLAGLCSELQVDGQGAAAEGAAVRRVERVEVGRITVVGASKLGGALSRTGARHEATGSVTQG